MGQWHLTMHLVPTSPRSDNYYSQLSCDSSMAFYHLHTFFLICSYIWGAIADRKGRKPVILASLVLMGLSVAIFGFSVDFSMAVIFRFLVGFTNGGTHTYSCTAWLFNIGEWCILRLPRLDIVDHANEWVDSHPTFRPVIYGFMAVLYQCSVINYMFSCRHIL